MLFEEDLFSLNQLQPSRLAKKIGLPGYTQYKGNELIF